MSREAVPQFVRTKGNRDAGVAKVSLQDQPDRTRRDALPRFVDEERPALHIRGGASSK